jgi:predicted 3-demethylubiquinone-9 3-methyltransferase (glyoxalase superfamily)
VPTIVPNLWFDGQAYEAAEFYTSIFPNSRITSTMAKTPDMPGPDAEHVVVDFELDGQRYTAINGGAQFPFTEAVSLLVDCDGQGEVDYYWDRLIADGGKEVQCGWLTDKYGLSWQVFPKQAQDLMTDPDEGRRQRATQAMLGMIKIDLAAMQAAGDAVD